METISKAQKYRVCLTVRRACRTGTKVGFSDPLIARGSVKAYRIKATPGITG